MFKTIAILLIICFTGTLHMKALIPNSGTGSRMGDLTRTHPKCMTVLHYGDTILQRQLKQLVKHGIRQVIITTGYYDQVLIDYCAELALPLDIEFVRNPKYDQTNYIYSVYLAREHLDDDILFLHGDLVFEDSVLKDVLDFDGSCMTTSTAIPLPPKDFKAVVQDGQITKVGVNYFDNARAAQPLYKLNKKDWKVWLDEIERFCENGDVKVYAEEAFNKTSDKCAIYPMDFGLRLCEEIDTPADLEKVNNKLKGSNNETKNS